MGANTVIRARRNLLAACLLLTASIATAGIWDEGDIEAGQSLFNANCASCHKVTNEVLAAPGLAGIADRWGSSEELLVNWIQNPQGAAESGDSYIKSIVARYVPTYGWMTAQAVSAEDIKNIMAYVQNPPDAAPVADSGSDCITVDEIEIIEESGGSGVWFLILLVLFLIIALSAAGVNRSLTNAVNQSTGEDVLEELPYESRARNWAWNNRAVVSLIGLFFVAYGAVLGYQGLMRVGVVEGYKPNQPIQFIHSVHVCENEVDCKYCHHSAYESKHAGIPSTNVCMNCHKAVKKGRRYGETEIAKIYDAIDEPNKVELGEEAKDLRSTNREENIYNRKDYHYNETPEFFYQIEGDIILKIIDNGVAKDIHIKEGDIYLLPSKVPHSPQRGANTVGIVIEYPRPSGVEDALEWYCENCNHQLFRAPFVLDNIETDMPAIFDRYYSSQEKCTCSKCGNIMEAPNKI